MCIELQTILSRHIGDRIRQYGPKEKRLQAFKMGDNGLSLLLTIYCPHRDGKKGRVSGSACKVEPGTGGSGSNLP